MLRDEIKNYRQPDLLVAPKESPEKDSTGNGIFYSSLYYLALHLRGEMIGDDVAEFRRIIEACEIRNQPGCFKRSPTKDNDQTGKDDYYGILACCYLFGLTHISTRIYEAGACIRWFPLRWVYDIEEPGHFRINGWFGRFPEWTCVVKSASRKAWPNIFDEIKYSVHILTQVFFSKDDTTCWILSYLNSLSVRPVEGFFSAIAHELLDSAIKRRGGMPKLLELHLGADHPIAKHWPKG